MSNETWDAVDGYFGDLLLGSDPVLDSALAASEAAGLPQIAVAPNQGALLNLLARAVGARRILEVGTLGGYSSIWMARALPKGGRLITLEVDRKHADVARANFGKGLKLLEQLAAEKPAPFDMAFIDADKSNNAAYFDWALKLSRPGSIIVIDNVVRGGAVARAGSFDADVLGVRALAERMAGEKRIKATVIQTVGVKGYDGLAIAVVL